MLAALRERHRWSQGFAAAVIGISASAVAKVGN
jgi:hypothetical protein